MGINPNIILQGQTAPADPFAMVQKATDMKNALIQTQSNQQTLTARNALGEIYQKPGVVDEQGNLDSNKLLYYASQDPRTAFMAADIAKQAQDRQAQQATIASTKAGTESTQQTITKQKYDNAKQHIDNLKNVFATILANPNATAQDYQRAGLELVMQGTVTPDEYQGVMNSMPTDPAQLRDWGMRQWAGIQSADKQLDSMFGTQVQQDTGGQVVTMRTSPITGQHILGQVDKTLTPAESNTPAYTRYNPATGQQEIVTQGAAQAAKGGAPEGIAATAPPGVNEARVAAAEDNTKQGQAVLTAANDTRQNVIPLISEAKSLLKQGALTGPNADTAKLAGQFASQFGIDVKGIAPTEVLGKVLEQIAGRQSQALAGGGVNSDAKLASAKTSTPNPHMSALGLQGALATVEGNANAITLQGAAYQKFLDAGGSPAQYNQFRSQFNKVVDPFVLAVQALPAEQQAEVFKTMTPEEHKKYNQALANIQAMAGRVGWQP